MINSLFLATLILLSQAEARVDVRSVNSPKPLYELKLKYMFAIGQEDKTGDLVTVSNGRVYVARPQGTGGVKIDDSMKTVTSSLLLTHVKHWTEVQIENETRSSDSIAPFMNEVLKKTGYELAGVFPFLIKGKFEKLDLQKSSSEKVSGVIVGFMTKVIPLNHASVQFTLAMHFIDDAGKTFGSVQSFKIAAHSKTALFLPE